MRMVCDSHAEDGFWDLVCQEAPDWRRARCAYDPAWNANAPRFSTAATTMGGLICSCGDLAAYGIKKLPEAGGKWIWPRSCPCFPASRNDTCRWVWALLEDR